MRQTHRPLIVAVDGPAGSGKSSICKSVAGKIGFNHINTGALYRSIGYLASLQKLSKKDEVGLCNLAKSFRKNGSHDPASGKIYYEGMLLNPQLYSEAIGWWASNIATLKELRKELLPVQREWSLKCNKGAILDGRDTGTIVFPDADLKIYLTACPEIRALRRQAQLQRIKNQGKDKIADLQTLTEDLIRRDRQDSRREVAPLKKPDDALLLDSSHLSVDETIRKMVEMILSRPGHRPENGSSLT